MAPPFLCCLADLVSYARQSTGNHDAHATGPDGDDDPHSELSLNTESASPRTDSWESPANEPKPVITKRLDPLDLRQCMPQTLWTVNTSSVLRAFTLL